MSFKKVMLFVFCGVVVFSFFLNCAGPKEVVKEEPPEKKEEVVKEVVKEPEPEVEVKPMEWTTRVKDADVKLGGKAVYVPKAYDAYSLTLRSFGDNQFELLLEQSGAAPKLLFKGTSTLKPDSEGKIAFHITEVNEGNVQPLFDVLGLRALKKHELRDNYYLYGSLKKSGVSTLQAFDAGNSVVMKFTLK